jgi:hypothetical protein
LLGRKKNQNNPAGRKSFIFHRWHFFLTAGTKKYFYPYCLIGMKKPSFKPEVQKINFW